MVPNKGERILDKLELLSSHMTTYRMVKDGETGTALPARRSLSPTRTESRQARRGRSLIRALYSALPSLSIRIEHRFRKSVQASKRPIAYFGKHAGSRRRDILSCGLPSKIRGIAGEPVAGATVGGRRPPTVGGRDLPEEFEFKTFCDWIRHELEEETTPPGEDRRTGLECQHPDAGRGLTGVSPRPFPQLAVMRQLPAIPSEIHRNIVTAKAVCCNCPRSIRGSAETDRQIMQKVDYFRRVQAGRPSVRSESR